MYSSCESDQELQAGGEVLERIGNYLVPKLRAMRNSPSFSPFVPLSGPAWTVCCWVLGAFSFQLSCAKEGC